MLNSLFLFASLGSSLATLPPLPPIFHSATYKNTCYLPEAAKNKTGKDSALWELTVLVRTQEIINKHTEKLYFLWITTKENTKGDEREGR